MHRDRLIGFIGACALLIPSAHGQQLGSGNAATTDVKPIVSELPISGSTVTDLHLRPMFTTTIRLPEPVTSVAIGAPTLFEVEHSDQEPRLVFVKPSTKDAATSNLVIALQSGQEISITCLYDLLMTFAGGDMVYVLDSPQSNRTDQYGIERLLEWKPSAFSELRRVTRCYDPPLKRRAQTRSGPMLTE